MPSPDSKPSTRISTADPARLKEALARIDAANAADPEREIVAGQSRPGALLYSERMTACLNVFSPQASDALRVAVRAQHVERWKIARTTYPAGRKGYHEWRTTLARFHAERTGALLRDAGFDEPFIARVQSLLRKEQLERDPEAQTLEDVACLVFLQHYFLDFSRKHEAQKILDIVRKTWRKMSPHGQQSALQLSLPPEAAALVQRALTA